MYRLDSVMSHKWRTYLALFALTLLSACGGSDEPTAAQSAASEAEYAARKAAMLAHMQKHFDTEISLPPAVQEALEIGEISPEEIEQRVAAGEFEKFFQFKTPADIPAELIWDDGMDLPEIGSDDATKGGTLYLSLSDFPRTLRVVGPDSNGSFRAWLRDETSMGFANRHPTDTSIDSSGNFRYFPGIAQSWALSEDGKTVYVRINPAAQFNDGVPITSDDIMFSFYFWQQPFIQAPWYNNNFKRNYTAITKYDTHTFSLTLPEAKPSVLSRALELEPMPLHFFYEFGEDFVERYQWEFVPTSGPYVLTEENLKKGRSVTLLRKKNWWAKDMKFWRNRFNVDRVNLTIIRDQAKTFEAFKKGEISFASISLPEYFYEKLPATDELITSGWVHRAVFYNDTPRPTYGLWINSGRPLLNNRDVRVGINYATNFQKVIDEYFRGDYTRMRTRSDGYGEFTHPTLTAREYDVEKALASFAQAGFVQRGPDGVLVNDNGERLSFTLTTGYEALKDILTILRQEALRAGLEFRLEVLDGTASWKKIQEKQHDIAFSAFNTGAEMFPRYWEFNHSVNAYDVPWLRDGSVNPERQLKPQTNNLQSIANRKLDKLIDEYRASDDVDEMKRLAFEIEELLYEDGSFVPGFVVPFLRVAYWRWVQWPDDFQVKIANRAIIEHLFWIDQAMEKETREARRTGQTFEVVDKVYDQYKKD